MVAAPRWQESKAMFTIVPWQWLALAVLVATPFVADLRRIQDRELARAAGKWQAMTAATCVLAIATYELWLAFVGLALFMRWRTHHLTASIVPWTLIGALWFIAGSLPGDLVAWLPTGWLIVSGLELALAIWQWFNLPPPPGTRTRRPIGTFGQRTLLACWFALVLPFAMHPWYVSAISLGGLALTSSWLAYLAVLAGLAVLVPRTLYVTIPLLVFCAGVIAFTRWFEYTPRGDTTDSIRQRLLTWRYAWAHLRQYPTWLVGRGPYTSVYDLLRWCARYRQELVYGHFHCEPLEFVYEWGVPGALALIAFAVRVVPHLQVGDPWSAAIVTGAALACGTLFCRCAPLGATWLAMCSIVAHGGQS